MEIKDDSAISPEFIRQFNYLQNGDNSAVKGFRESVLITSLSYIFKRCTQKTDVVEDIFAETFSKFITVDLHKYKGENFENYHRLKAFFHKMIMNACIDYLRKKKINTVLLDEDDSNAFYNYVDNPYFESLAKTDMAKLLSHVFSRMKISESHQRIYKYRYKDGLEYSEIAAIEKMPVDTIRKIIKRKDLELFELHKPEVKDTSKGMRSMYSSYSCEVTGLLDPYHVNIITENGETSLKLVKTIKKKHCPATQVFQIKLCSSQILLESKWYQFKVIDSYFGLESLQKKIYRGE